MVVCQDMLRVADDIDVTTAVYGNLTLAESTASVYGEQMVMSTIFWMIYYDFHRVFFVDKDLGGNYVRSGCVRIHRHPVSGIQLDLIPKLKLVL